MSGLKGMSNWERMQMAGKHHQIARRKTNHELRATIASIAAELDHQDCADLLEAGQRLTVKPIVEAETIRRN